MKSTGIGKRSVENCGGLRSNLRMANYESSSTRHRLMGQTWCDQRTQNKIKSRECAIKRGPEDS
jgi:hypothetical protein